MKLLIVMLHILNGANLLRKDSTIPNTTKCNTIQLRIAHDKTKYTSYIVKKRNL